MGDKRPDVGGHHLARAVSDALGISRIRSASISAESSGGCLMTIVRIVSVDEMEAISRSLLRAEAVRRDGVHVVEPVCLDASGRSSGQGEVEK